MRKIFVARPRLDCSFKKGDVPTPPGPPRNEILRLFGKFIDGLELYHRSMGDIVTSETRPLWQFDLDYMRNQSLNHDRVYFPHMLKEQFPIGDNALYYKNSPLLSYYTVDPIGWGASLSFLPPQTSKNASPISISELRKPIALNQSIFAQPRDQKVPIDGRYIFFPCQLPHDETIRFHSKVTVEAALEAVIHYAEQRHKKLLIKGHPANPRSMAPLKARSERSKACVWTDDVSIHACLSGADRVFLVNSGSGMEAMLHDRCVIRFGEAEYSCVTPKAEPNLQSLIELEDYTHSSSDYEKFLVSFAQNCICLNDFSSYQKILASGR